MAAELDPEMVAWIDRISRDALVNMAAKTPRYVRIAAELRQEIKDGLYGPGDRLPAETALAQRFAVSFMTLRRALTVLRSEGLIESHQGVGTFVCLPSPVSDEQRERAVFVVQRALDSVVVPGDLALHVVLELIYLGWRPQ